MNRPNRIRPLPVILCVALFILLSLKFAGYHLSTGSSQTDSDRSNGKITSRDDQTKGKNAAELRQELDAKILELQQAKGRITELNKASKQHKCQSSSELEKKLISSQQAFEKLKTDKNKLEKELSEKDTQLAKYALAATSPFEGQKLVHLDMKGAPPKISYLLKLLPLYQKLGATGLLIEYEDMFPYQGKLAALSRNNSYTIEDINKLQAAALKLKLSIIPLIQTFGHMEFVLKHRQFAHLNEVSHHKMVICSTCNGSQALIEEMITQILSLHSGVDYIHIGGDEVYDLYKHKDSQSKFPSKEKLFTSHIMSISTYISKHFSNVRVIIWDDMLRTWNVSHISSLKDYVIPMVWAYWSNLDEYFPTGMWQRYTKVFREIWIASAFKGAGGSDNDFPPIQQHVGNHESWLKIISSLQDTGVTVTGIALTGWSRYDHFANMVELMPAGITSLALCLGVLEAGEMNHKVITTASRRLGCKSNITLAINRKYKAENCSFYGSTAFYAIGIYYQGTVHYDRARNVIPTWHTKFQRNRDRISPFRLERAYAECIESKKYLQKARRIARKVFSKLFYSNDIYEWMITKIVTKIANLDNLLAKLKDYKVAS